LATIEDIISRVQSAGQKVSESAQLLDAAETAAGQLQNQLTAAGIQDKAAQLAQVRESIQRTRQHLLGSRD
jgi:hypothetical protein